VRGLVREGDPRGTLPGHESENEDDHGAGAHGEREQRTPPSSHGKQHHVDGVPRLSSKAHRAARGEADEECVSFRGTASQQGIGGLSTFKAWVRPGPSAVSPARPLPAIALGPYRGEIALGGALPLRCHRCRLHANQMLVAKLRIDRRMARAPVTRCPPSTHHTRTAATALHAWGKTVRQMRVCSPWRRRRSGLRSTQPVLPSEASPPCGEWPSNERRPDSFGESANFPGNPGPPTLS
jgi:hypothetical protein